MQNDKILKNTNSYAFRQVPSTFGTQLARYMHSTDGAVPTEVRFAIKKMIHNYL